jgi:hypothetical protein
LSQRRESEFFSSQTDFGASAINLLLNVEKGPESTKSSKDCKNMKLKKDSKDGGKVQARIFPR